MARLLRQLQTGLITASRVIACAQIQSHVLSLASWLTHALQRLVDDLFQRQAAPPGPGRFITGLA